MLAYALLPDAVRDAVLALLTAGIIGLVRVVWALGSRLSRLEGELDAADRDDGPMSLRRSPSDRRE